MWFLVTLLIRIVVFSKVLDPDWFLKWHSVTSAGGIYFLWFLVLFWIICVEHSQFLHINWQFFFCLIDCVSKHYFACLSLPFPYLSIYFAPIDSLSILLCLIYCVSVYLSACLFPYLAILFAPIDSLHCLVRNWQE